MRFEEFTECQAWWGDPGRQGRGDNEHAWYAPIAEIERENFNLDRKNPNRKTSGTEHLPEVVAATILRKGEELAALVAEIAKDVTHLRS